MKTKKCKHCQSDIPANAKVCAQCGRKQGGKLKWIIIAVVILAIIGAVAGGGGSSDSTEPAASPASSAAAKTPVKEQTEEKAPAQEEAPAEEAPAEQPVEYAAYTVNEMMADLDNNAASASDKYKGQYLEITGRLSNIDSDGKYISLHSDDEFAIIGVQCYLKTDEQKQAIRQFSKDQTVTVRGKCTDVGEVLGYSLDVDSIG